MKNVVIILMLFAFTTISVQAQNYDLPPNPEEGKCYEKCFHYDKKLTWEEVDCSKIKEQNTKMTKEQLEKNEARRQKMLAYQEKLKSLGYDVDITGVADNKTIMAHHKYLKTKKKKK